MCFCHGLIVFWLTSGLELTAAAAVDAGIHKNFLDRYAR